MNTPTRDTAVAPGRLAKLRPLLAFSDEVLAEAAVWPARGPQDLPEGDGPCSV